LGWGEGFTGRSQGLVRGRVGGMGMLIQSVIVINFDTQVRICISCRKMRIESKTVGILKRVSVWGGERGK
jgi:hypothetical protein